MKTHMSATRTHRGLLRAGIAGLSLVLLGAIPASAQIPVSGGAEIKAPGNYILSGNSSGGIIISSGGVDLSLGGYTLTGSGGYGVLVTAGSGVRIHHGTIQGFGVGVQLEGPTSDGRVDHVTFAGNPGVGVVDDGSMNKVDQNSVANSWIGILVRGVHSSIKDNVVASGFGISLENASNAVVKGNTVKGDQVGVLLNGATTGHTVMNNRIDLSGVGIQLNGAGVSGNLIKGNLVTRSTYPGILLFDRTNGNMVSQNTLNNNGTGIDVSWTIAPPAVGNIFQDNTALNNVGPDLVEVTDPTIGTNTWRRNIYQTRVDPYGAIPPSL